MMTLYPKNSANLVTRTQFQKSGGIKRLHPRPAFSQSSNVTMMAPRFTSMMILVGGRPWMKNLFL
jgi:hypothetical protein